MGLTTRLGKRYFPSLRARVLWGAFAVVILFVALTAVVLERAFAHGLRARLEAQLEVQTWGLLGVADELKPGVLFLPDSLPDQRLNQLSSGRYARVVNSSGKVLWKSPSAQGLEWAVGPLIAPGDSRISEVKIGDGSVYQRDFGVAWENSKGATEYDFQVAESTQGLDAAVRDFRRQLYQWLGFMGLIFLFGQYFFLRLGLGPLRRVSKELVEVEAGIRERLASDYPTELEQLTLRINQLLTFEQAQRSRYRNSLADLAHSLKTPLGVLMTLLEGVSDTASTFSPDFELQIKRINKTISYYLNRAAVSGAGNSLTIVRVAPVLSALCQSLAKVYHDSTVQLTAVCDPDAIFLGVEGDFMEMLGNILDNAYKYGGDRIDVKVTAVAPVRDGRGGVQKASTLVISVDDNGSGIPADEYQDVLKRGARLDETAASGQGIGLALVADIVRAYEGHLSLSRSALGGCRFEIVFGGHP